MKIRSGSKYPEKYFAPAEAKPAIVDIEFTLMADGGDDNTNEKPEPKTVDVKFDGLYSEEIDYKAERNAEIQEAVKPLLEENTKRVIQEQHDKFKLEVHEVLADEVSHRLGKYEKRRRRREFREGFGVVLKWLIVAAIVFVLLSNDQLRNQMVTIAGDVKEIVVGLINNEEVSSNKLVNDVLDLVESEDTNNE